MEGGYPKIYAWVQRSGPREQHYFTLSVFSFCLKTKHMRGFMRACQKHISLEVSGQSVASKLRCRHFWHAKEVAAEGRVKVSLGELPSHRDDALLWAARTRHMQWRQLTKFSVPFSYTPKARSYPIFFLIIPISMSFQLRTLALVISLVPSWDPGKTNGQI